MTLEARAITVEVGGRVLLRDTDLSVAPGTMTVVVGPNGTGKTTLLKSLCGLVPVGGQIKLGGTPLAALDPRARARSIAYLPQQTQSAPGLTVRDAVQLGRLPHRSRLAGPSAIDHAQVDACLDRVGMRAFAARALQTLSGGERQRVMLARMLATEAPVMLLDEPTAALDIRHALEFLQSLRDLVRANRAVVLALHDLPLADAYADQVICLPGDGTTTVGPPAEVLTTARIHEVFGASFIRNNAGALQLLLPRNAATSHAPL